MSEYPSLPEQGKNLAKFTFDVIKKAIQSDEGLLVSSEIKEQRLTICRSCEWYDASQVRCKHCGCFLEQKAAFSIDSCPIDKWKESDTDWMNGNYKTFLDSLESETE